MGLLDGKVALITGAGSGIGKASALRMAGEGAKVVAVDISGAQDTTVAEIRAAGGEATAVRADVTKSADVQAMVEAARRTYGGLHIMHNNAAYPVQRMPMTDFSEEYFDNVISVNLKGVFLGMKYAIPAMIASGGGSIVNTSSVAGLGGAVHASVYGASKAGVISFTKSAALEFAKQNIRVNAICPSAVDTPRMRQYAPTEEERRAYGQRTPVGRLCTAEEVADLALFLASDQASFISGTAVPIDAGSSAS